MTFDVLNPGGRDPDQSFPNGAGSPEDPGHPPVNYHGYAACLRGGFRRDVRAAHGSAVLVLLRKRNLRQALAAVRILKTRGATVLVSCKESGSHQIAEFLGDAGRWRFFREICLEADGALASTPELVALYQSAGAGTAGFVPTPYPLDSPAWDFSVPLDRRHGIFVGTREFDVPSRNHFAAVATSDTLSRATSSRVTVVNVDGRRGRSLLEPFRKDNPRFRILEGPLSYPDYLKEMAGHRIVWQLDSSAVPGQVAGDALLCGIPCLGGNGAVDRLAFPEWSGSVPRDALMHEAACLLAEDSKWHEAAMRSRRQALENLSFASVSEKMKALFAEAGT